VQSLRRNRFVTIPACNLLLEVDVKLSQATCVSVTTVLIGHSSLAELKTSLVKEPFTRP